MKLKKFNSDELICYYHSTKPVELPDFKFNEKGIRGVWVSNVANIDTPKTTNMEEYKEYLVKMIANIASYNINLIVFQVRPTSDAYYPSKLNPWSRFITGTEGLDPGFDVLGFVIEEAKKYGIEVHAWMNPYRVASATLEQMGLTKEAYLETLAPLNYARRHPEDTILDGSGKVILKPASETVIQFVTDTIMEVVENYDVTGVHIDDYFYPYAKVPVSEEEEDFNKAKVANPELSMDDWRRDNVNKMIQKIHEALSAYNKKNKKHVEFGISPFAIYRTHISLKEDGWEKGSLHSAGALQCYTDLYSDVYKWMEEGWIDYVVPQVYFSFERRDVNYHDLAKWWVERTKETGTKLYIGQGLYQMGSNEVWQNPLEIDNQLRFNEQFDNISGTIFFTYRDLVPGQNMIKDASIALLKARWNEAKIAKELAEKASKPK